MKRLLGVILCAILSAVLFGVVLPGCGGGTHATLFVISSGTPAIGLLNIGSGGSLTLSTTTFPTGANPQGMLLDTQHNYAYVVNNAGPGLQGGVLQYTYDGKRELQTVQAPNATSNITGPVLPVLTGVQPVAMALNPNATFVFVANSGSNSISVFSLDPTYGELNEVTGSPFPTGTGTMPVSLCATNSMLFVANQASATVAAYTFSSSTGALTAAGTPVAVGTNTTSIACNSAGSLVFVADGTANTVSVLSAGSSGLTAASSSVAVGTAPSNLFIDHSGSYLYVANSGSNNVSAFTIGSGSLTPVSGSPYAAGTGPSFITSNTGGGVLFVANRGSATVSSYSVGSGGSLTPENGSPFAASGFNSLDGLVTPD